MFESLDLAWSLLRIFPRDLLKKITKNEVSACVGGVYDIYAGWVVGPFSWCDVGPYTNHHHHHLTHKPITPPQLNTYYARRTAPGVGGGAEEAKQAK